MATCHQICNSLGTSYIFWSMKRDDKTGTEGLFQKLLGHLVRKDLDKSAKVYIAIFSMIFSFNIAIGNVSLRHVSVNFNQVMRSLVPAFTILFGIMLGRKFTTRRMVSVAPVIVGVAMACFGDMTYTVVGFIYTLGCVLLAAIKVVVAGEMLTGTLKLHPVDLLGHLAPLAMIQNLILSIVSGEMNKIWRHHTEYIYDSKLVWVVLCGGLTSFTLNITSLMANKLTSPLTLCISGNVKQVLMIVISTILFSTPITPLNGAGIIVVLIGSSIYSYISLQEKSNSNAGEKKISSSANIQLSDKSPLIPESPISGNALAKRNCPSQV